MERVIEDPAGVQQRVLVNLGESPLTWLHTRGLVSHRQFDAGEKLRADWERAGLGPRVTMRWDAAPLAKSRRSSPDAPEPTHIGLSARARFDGALKTAGPGMADVLWRVVCAGEGIGAAEKALGWPVRAGKLVLGMALDRVADFYAV